MAEVKVKTISYKPNGNQEEHSGFDPFYGSEGENLIEFPREGITDPFKPRPGDTRKTREGILNHLAQMSESKYREFMGGFLTPYGYREKDLLEMPIKKLEELFDEVISYKQSI